MSVKYFQVNTQAIQEQMRAEKERQAERGQRLNFFDPAKGYATYFYLMPPYNQRGILGREVHKFFNLPDPDRKWAVCWRTYDILTPGKSQEDPILKALMDVQKVAGEKVRRMWPGRYYYVNAVVIGVRRVDEHGTPFGEFQQASEIQTVVVSMSNALYDKLMSKTFGANLPYPICNPDTAACCVIKRWEKGGKSNSDIEIVGTSKPEGFVPEYENLFQKFGQDQVEQWLNALPDLDERWKGPTEEDVAHAHRISQAIRMQFGTPHGPSQIAPGQNFPTFASPTPVGRPGGFVPPPTPTAPAVPALPVAPPVQSVSQSVVSAPAQAPVVTAPAVAQPAAVAPPKGVQPPSFAVPGFGVAPSGQAPTAQAQVLPPGPPTVGMPSASPRVAAPGALGATTQAIPAPVPPTSGMTQPDLNYLIPILTGPVLPTPPIVPGTSQPVCFQHRNEVAASPQAAWCNTCPFEMPCRIASGGK